MATGRMLKATSPIVTARISGGQEAPARAAEADLARGQGQAAEIAQGIRQSPEIALQHDDVAGAQGDGRAAVP